MRYERYRRYMVLLRLCEVVDKVKCTLKSKCILYLCTVNSTLRTVHCEQNTDNCIVYPCRAPPVPHSPLATEVQCEGEGRGDQEPAGRAHQAGQGGQAGEGGEVCHTPTQGTVGVPEVPEHMMATCRCMFYYRAPDHPLLPTDYR